MKAIMRIALVSFFAIGTACYAQGGKDCKGCKQKTCTSKCQLVCGKTQCSKLCSDSSMVTIKKSGCGKTCGMKKG
jgi:hypothetical protein